MPERKDTAKQLGEKKQAGPGQKQTKANRERKARKSILDLKDASGKGSVGLTRVENAADRRKLLGKALSRTSQTSSRITGGARRSSRGR